MQRTCSSLKTNEAVVFQRYSDLYEKKIPWDGTVSSVDLDKKAVWVSWMEGYKTRIDLVPYEDMLAVYDPQGEYMRFGTIRGKSAVLINA